MRPRIIVPWPGNAACAAHLCLTSEGVEHEVVYLPTELSYGSELAREWRKGDGFIVVEHDICPWPGLMQQMWDCPEPFCGAEYHHPHIGDGLERSLGCTKFSSELIALIPDAHLGKGDNGPAWDTVHWRYVDGAVYDALLYVDVKLRSSMHVHTPAVAHARAY